MFLSVYNKIHLPNVKARTRTDFGWVNSGGPSIDDRGNELENWV
jgi:hypothetical protein